MRSLPHSEAPQALPSAGPAQGPHRAARSAPRSSFLSEQVLFALAPPTLGSTGTSTPSMPVLRIAFSVERSLSLRRSF